jgi:quercetin dioxygenase-like cupin family protein
MTREEIEKKYQDKGLVTRYIIDKPGEVYEPHRHGEVWLYTLKGSAKIKLDDKQWITVAPLQEVTIDTNQLHEAIVGNEGWEYVFAASAEEIKRQQL